MTDPISPPYNEEIEKAVISTLVVHGDKIDASKDLTMEDFYLPKHKEIFEALVDIHSEGQAVDYLTVAARVNGLKDYILEICSVFYPDPVGHFPMHKQSLKELGFKRQVLKSMYSQEPRTGVAGQWLISKA